MLLDECCVMFVVVCCLWFGVSCVPCFVGRCLLFVVCWLSFEVCGVLCDG